MNRKLLPLVIGMILAGRTVPRFGDQAWEPIIRANRADVFAANLPRRGSN